jgi:hypothetical protein
MSERRPERAEPEPPYVTSAAERRRWDLAQAIARALFEDEAGTDPAAIWMATRAVYRSRIKTGE